MPREGIRAFVALELGPVMRERLGTLIAELRERLGGVSWVRPEGMHLTLRFLGDSAPAALAALEPWLRAAADRCPPATTTVSGLGVFPGSGRARVLWIGVALPPAVLALQSDCEAAAVSAGFAPEARPFKAHLTLGRWRDGGPRPELPHRDLGDVRLESLVLYRSELAPAGARYTPLQAFPLGGA